MDLIIFLLVPFLKLFNKEKSTNIYWKFDNLCFFLWIFFINQKNDYFEFSTYDLFILSIIFLVPLTIKLIFNVITNSAEETLYNEENFSSSELK